MALAPAVKNKTTAPLTLVLVLCGLSAPIGVSPPFGPPERRKMKSRRKALCGYGLLISALAPFSRSSLSLLFHAGCIGFSGLRCVKTVELTKGGYRSGQTGQTVNLLSLTSLVRIQLHPLDRICFDHQLGAVSSGTASGLENSFHLREFLVKTESRDTWPTKALCKQASPHPRCTLSLYE